MPNSAIAPRQAPTDVALAKALSPVVLLLAISVFINYIDRGSLSIAAPAIKTELLLSPWQLGILLSSFFWTYTAFQIVSGWLVDRFEVNWVIAGGFFLWSIATAATGLVHGFELLLVVRLILGIGESVAFPSYSKILAKHFPESLRGRANSFIAAGIAGGPAFGVFFGAILIAHYGWRPFFLGLGLLCLLWLLPWLIWMPKGPGFAASSAAKPPGIAEILAQRSAWGTFGGLFSYNYLSYFLLTWLPFYLVRERHFSMENMGKIGGAAYLTLAASALISGWLSDFWIARGVSPTRVRKTFTALGLGLASCFCIAVVVFAFDSRLALFFSFCHLRRRRPLHFESMGNHTDARRASRRRQMDRPAKLRRQSFWNCLARVDRLRRRTNRPFLLGIRRHIRGSTGGRALLGLCRCRGRAGAVAICSGRLRLEHFL
ncbi:MAG: MFS transporter [Candidatus Acidiferrum sp.]